MDKCPICGSEDLDTHFVWGECLIVCENCGEQFLEDE